MATVVLSAHDVVEFPQGGGHLSAYLQYAHGLRELGCEVWWLERSLPSGDLTADRERAGELGARLEQAGLGHRLILYSGDRDAERSYLTVSTAEAEAVFRRADLLLNFHYEIDAELLGRFQRTAMVDVDPGLLQLWIHHRDLRIERHDRYFTTGETVGTPRATFPSEGIDWIHIRPPVSLAQWPVVRETPRNGFTTVSSWWSEEWVAQVDGTGWYPNTKRESFLQYLHLPELTSVPLELALNIAPDDNADVELLERHGWRVRAAREITSTPAAYREYIQRSTGEFSCAKPSCMVLQNAWISDRTICYLASGRPAVVQHTGPSPELDGCPGLMRFASPAEAAEALGRIGEGYAERCAAARDLAATLFDSRKVAASILDAAFAQAPRAPAAG
jgi:hypothetical protein